MTGNEPHPAPLPAHQRVRRQVRTTDLTTGVASALSGVLPFGGPGARRRATSGCAAPVVWAFTGAGLAPTWTAHQVLWAMIGTAGRPWDRDMPSKYLGHGLIRPRLVLEQAGIDPGPPGTDPLARENGTGVAAPEGEAARRSTWAGGGSRAPWLAGGVVAGGLVSGGGVFGVLRARRRT
ncbi:hypothetical protein ACFYNY_19585 [Streptomyces sp. NPDC006530]|uniref:hypothetical protein n=1 Tax=Streptomyces sp. NPDC006530 TaxID=3364750 RepID=UPI0036AC5E93